jgi:hypothetical protein
MDTMSLLLTTTSSGFAQPITFGSMASGSAGRSHVGEGIKETVGAVGLGATGFGLRHESERRSEQVSQYRIDLILRCVLHVASEIGAALRLRLVPLRLCNHP